MWPPLFPKAPLFKHTPPWRQAYGVSDREFGGKACSIDMMALDNYFLFTHQPSLDWDLHAFEAFEAFGVGDLHEHMPLDLESPMSSEASTGYLQDAVTEWSDRCKRRRVESSLYDPMAAEELEDLLQGFWNSNISEDSLANLSYMDNINASDENLTSSVPFKETNKQEEAAPQLQHDLLLCSPSSQAEPVYNEENDTKPPLKERESSHDNERKKRKKKIMGLAYPFAVVKPGGLEGDITLSDINERLLMRPTRPVRHPVGEFACVPCVAADGVGLSGKAIVGFTRIHTQGRGTITIIRTRG